jgi:hypothetical protein
MTMDFVTLCSPRIYTNVCLSNRDSIRGFAGTVRASIVVAARTKKVLFFFFFSRKISRAHPSRLCSRAENNEVSCFFAWQVLDPSPSTLRFHPREIFHWTVGEWFDRIRKMGSGNHEFKLFDQYWFFVWYIEVFLYHTRHIIYQRIQTSVIYCILM